MALTPAELLEKALSGESLDDDGAGEGTTTTTTTQEDPKDNNAEGAADAAKTGAADQGKATGGAGTTEDDEPKGAPIASKSGAYTIPYEKLEQSRERVKSLEGENESLRAQLAELNAKQQANLEQAEDKAQARADAGKAQTQADQNLEAAKTAMGQGVDASLFGDFSEEGIAKGIAALMGRTREELREELRAELREEAARELKPIKDREAKEVKDEHYGAIYEKHPDANEIVQSVEFKAWVNGLPGFQRGAVDAVLHPETGGTAAQVIEVFDTFKAQTGMAAAPAAQDKGKAPEVQRRVPNSLSEIAGEQHQDIAQQVLASAGTNPNALLERMQDMSPEQIERVMNAV
ncbi:hypothetical protein IB236_13125 [Acidovorax sp. ACV02]|uniref:hypothetical protein n=1 Tax=Acidovorax sp. ACV02 TaxID=2769310 RepID=UPI00177C4382|nr:hypothetical protein [Acidovorax sp. ACV02]MBD9406284.1 hypothetical protein [Acidovorax sp. ACV02]